MINEYKCTEFNKESIQRAKELGYSDVQLAEQLNKTDSEIFEFKTPTFQMSGGKKGKTKHTFRRMLPAGATWIISKAIPHQNHSKAIP